GLPAVEPARAKTLGLEPEHVGHAVEPRRLAARPQRGMHRAAGEDDAAAGAVAELETLAVGSEHHQMVAGDVAAAQGGEAHLAGRARAGPSRVRRATWSSATPRPAAAARPRPSAVPDGASTLWR